MKNNKTLIKFLIILIISFISIEILEYVLQSYFNFKPNMGGLGWLGILIFFGFKYHIFCCLLPAIWVGWKCRHKKCDHDYCNTDKKNNI